MGFKLQPRLTPRLDSKELMAALTPGGNKVAEFEDGFAQKFECDHGVMFSHGRAGLYSLFKVWGLDGDEIICPAYTCVVVQHAIALSGNIPVFVDCAPGSFNMSYEGIAEAISEKTRAIVVTHLFGYPMDVERVDRMVKEAEERYGHKIYVIQDVAHSFGARWQGELVTKYGDAAIFGLNVSKILTSIFGGMVTTNSPETHEALKSYREAHFVKKGWFKSLKRLLYLVAIYIAFQPVIYQLVNYLERKGFLDRFVKYYEEGEIDFPSDWKDRPTDLEARVGLAQLEKYDEIIESRRNRALQYLEELKDLDITFMADDPGCTYSHCTGLVSNREDWIERYRKKGVQLGIIVEYCVPYMKAYRKFAQGEYPVAKAYADASINFPLI